MFKKKSIFNIKNNTLILIEGDDKFKFIQGIISNDIEILKKKKSIYASILTPQGSFLYDFFITYSDNFFLLECCESNTQEILKKLNLYKLKSNVTFKVESNLMIFFTNYSNLALLSSTLKGKLLYFSDPRFSNELTRIYVNKEYLSQFLKEFNLLSEEEFNEFRITKTIPDFNVDALKNKSLLLEMRFDELNGISWEKGCYMGQEITARMKYRNIIKKKIFCVSISFNNVLDKKIFSNNKEIGELFSHNKYFGIAYINTNFDFKKNQNVLCGDSSLKISIPWWSNNNSQ